MVAKEPVTVRLNAGLESGVIAVTENLSKFVAGEVVIPEPLITIVFNVETVVAITGLSGSEKKKIFKLARAL